MSGDLRRKKSDYLLKLALEEQLERDPEMLKYKSGDEVENPHEFSKEHEKRIAKILKKAAKAEKRPQRIRRYRQIAAGFILFFCVSIFTIMQVEAVRLPLIRFFMEIKEKSTLFKVDQKNDHTLSENNEVYEPHYIPDGFDVLSMDEEDGSYYIKYLNNQKQQGYSYYFFDSMENTAVDTESGYTIEMEINGNRTYVVQKEEEIRILMYKNNKRFSLIGNIPYEEAIKVMESIE